MPGTSEENTTTDDVDTSSDENNIPVISEENNMPIISEDNTNATTQTNRPKQTIIPIQHLQTHVMRNTNGMELK